MKRQSVRPTAAPPAEKTQHADEDAVIHLLAQSFEDKPIWAELWENFHDALFPAQLPPLELTSTPIPLPDPMAGKTNPWALGTATLVNGGVVTLLLFLGLGTTIHRLPKSASGQSIDLKDFTLFAPPSAPAHGGGGGGDHELTNPMVGRAPKQELMPIVPPQVQTLDNPRLPVDPAVAVLVKLPENPSLPNIGALKSPNVSIMSNGQGGPAGIGSHGTGGDGPGDGPGAGPGRDGNYGGSVYTPGVGGVTQPVPIVFPEAEFSDEARRSKYQGICMIAVIVDAHGYPQNPRVIQRLGMGLDEKAMEAVKKYRFKPALKDGKAVPVMITVAVNFRLY
jgi:TonB family protein